MVKTYWIVFVVVLTTALCNLPVEGKHVQLRPLSAREVYSILREAGREDAIPADRFITHGIEAEKESQPEPEQEPETEIDLTEAGRVLISADALNATTTLLDYTKNLNYTALLTAFIPTYNLTYTKPTFNFTTFNFTTLHSLKPGLNLTTLTSLKPGLNITALKPGLNLTTLTLGFITTRAVPKTVKTEVCFSSRSLNELYDEEIETEADGRQITDTDTLTMPTSGIGNEADSDLTSPSAISSPDVSSSPDSSAADSFTRSGSDGISGTGSRFGSEPRPARYPRPYRNQRLGSAAVTCVVVRRPQTSQNVRRRQSAQKLQNIRRPQSNRRPQNVRRPQPVRIQIVRRQPNVQRKQNVGRPQYVRRRQNAQRTHNTRRGRNERNTVPNKS